MTRDEKKKLGSFYTDSVLVNKIVDELEECGMLFPDMSIIDPCCGECAFLSELKNRGYDNVKGIDMDEKAVAVCNEKYPDIDVECANFININHDVKYDVVIGNPPYVPILKKYDIQINNEALRNAARSMGNNLWLPVFILSLEMLKENGVLAYVLPKNIMFVHAYHTLRKLICETMTIVSIVDLDKYFENVEGTQVVLILQNKKADDNHKIKYLDRDCKHVISVLQNVLIDEYLVFTTQQDVKLYKQFNKYEKMYECFNLNMYRGKDSTRTDDIARGRDLRKFGYKDDRFIVDGDILLIQNIYNKEAGITGSRSVTGHANVTCSVIETGDCEVAKYLLGILHSRVVAFYMFKCVYCSSFISTHLDKPYMRKLIVPPYDETIFNEIVKLVTAIEKAEYLSDEWFELLAEIDAYVYYAFDISNEDVLYIESELQKFRSKLWR